MAVVYKLSMNQSTDTLPMLPPVYHKRNHTHINHYFIDELLPFLVQLCHVSLTDGVLPASQKSAITWPSLKKQEWTLQTSTAIGPPRTYASFHKIPRKL